MKIDLEYPFTELYNAGYTHVSSEGRRLVTLKKFNGELVGTSYPRYLMSVKLGRFLTDQEEVDELINNINDYYEFTNGEKVIVNYYKKSIDKN